LGAGTSEEDTYELPARLGGRRRNTVIELLSRLRIPETWRDRLAARAPDWPRPALVALFAAPIVLVLGGAAIGVSAWLDHRSDQELHSVVQAATRDGLEISLATALRLAQDSGDDAEDLALRARLVATAILEHGASYEKAARSLLGRLEGEKAGLPNARVARAFLALSEGDFEAASAAVEPVTGRSEVAVEAARARALAAAAADDLEAAVAHASTAASARPTAPRHVSLYALLTALRGDTESALATLNGLGGDPLPVTRTARARILHRAGELEAASEEAEAVVASEAATDYQRAQAKLVLAEARLAQGDQAGAEERAREAAGLGAPQDERFALAVADVLERTGAAKTAIEVLDRLAEPIARPGELASLRARAALALGDLRAAQQALDSLPSGPQRFLLLGRLAEARGELKEAGRLYRRAAEDATYEDRARLRMARLALREGEAADAVELLEGLAAQPGDAEPEAVAVFVDALLSEGDERRAGRVVSRALDRRPKAPALIVAKARVDMAQGDENEALRAVRDLASERKKDADLHALLADLALRAGRRAEARDAAERALELDPRQPDALLVQARLAVRQQHVDAAKEALATAEEAGAFEDQRRRIELLIDVLEGGGAKAASGITNVPSSQRDAELWTALGRALVQAEEDRQAERAFRVALRKDEQQVEAYLGLALIDLRKGALSQAARQLGRAERAARRTDAGDVVEARIRAARARFEFENGNFGRAEELAREAIEIDEDNAEAHLVLANIAAERGNDPVPEFRRAASGRTPPPEALGLFVRRVGPTDEGCKLARRYLEAAPKGWDAREVRGVLQRCD
jgi:tetratricopeptide (TPR) repeat protein